MTIFYDVLEAVKGYLEENNSVNTVTFGDLLEVDLNKQTIFPLSHLTVRNVSFLEHTVSMTINVMALDIVNQSKDSVKGQVDPFFGNDNMQDVLNTQLAVLNGLQSSLRRGGLFMDDFIVTEDLSASIVQEKFENLLSGWTMDISIEIPNTQVSGSDIGGTGCL